MTKALIRKIKKIDNYRIFQNWKPSGNVEFARVNLIYGQNGSGKSTLANLAFGCAGGSEEELSAGLVASVETDGTGTQEVTSASDPAFWSRIRVFNKKFVEQNLAFNAEGGPRPQALLTIGKINVDAEQQLAKLRLDLEQAQSNIPKAKKEARAAKKAVDSRLTEVAKAITDDLLGTRISQYNPRSYNRSSVKDTLAALDTGQATLDGASTDLDTDRRTATGEAMSPVVLGTRRKIMDHNSVDAARVLLATDVVVQVIEELRDHPERATWVQRGISLHEHLEDCLFCGQPLTAGRRTELSAHFDDSLTILQRDIDSLINDLAASVRASKDYLDAIPIDASVYPDLRADLQEARAVYQNEHASYSQAVEEIVAVLTRKRDNPFSDLTLGPDIALNVPDTTKLETVVAKHRERTEGHDEEARDAARRVELYHIKDFAGEYKRLKKDAADKEKSVPTLEQQAESLQGQITSLENVDRNPVPGAEDLTEYVARLLGRDELVFSTTPDGKHYAIKRNGAPATNLSEGEQTAIALLYFLISVRPDKNPDKEPIVIIDDPVSSLDSGILFGASAHIWSEFVSPKRTDNNQNTQERATQVFLMTHNYELFREWLVQIDAVPAKIRNSDGGYAAFEIRATYKDNGNGHAARIPEFHEWKLGDKKTKKLRSYYHFLFSQVANCLIQAAPGNGLAEQMEMTALMPNAGRRMLESFLSFHCPHTMGSLHSSIQAALERSPNTLDESTRILVFRYLHTYSHLEEASTLVPLNPSESMSALSALFRFMDHVDHGHVSSMCTALGIDYNRLMKAPALPPSRSVFS